MLQTKVETKVQTKVDHQNYVMNEIQEKHDEIFSGLQDVGPVKVGFHPDHVTDAGGTAEEKNSNPSLFRSPQQCQLYNRDALVRDYW